MNYLTTPWVKLYRSPDADWVRLPLSARGLGSESLKYARSEDGFLIDTDGEALGVALAYFMGARPTEHERIVADAEKLVAHGLYELRGTRVYIRNFIDAQTRQSPSAIRKARQRAKDKAEQDAGRDVSRDVSRGSSHALSQGNETNRNEPNRHEPNTPPASPPVSEHLDLIQKEKQPRFDLEAIYKLYPRKEGKKEGIAKLQKLVRSEADYQTVLAGARRYADVCRRAGTEHKYIKTFSRWVNGEHWTDEPGSPVGKPAAVRHDRRTPEQVEEDEQAELARVRAKHGGPESYPEGAAGGAQ